MTIPKIAPYPMPTPGDLPASAVPWQLDPSRAVLIVHDLQQYFLSAFAPEADPVRTLVANTVRMLGAARAAGVPVVYTVQPAGQSRTQRGLLGDVWGGGIPTADEARIVAPVAPAPGDEVVTRTRYNAFLGSTLDNVLARHRCDQLVIAGVYAHIGCQVTAAHAFMTERQVFPVADAQADFSREHHDGAIAWLAGRAARVTDTESVVGAFERSAGGGGGGGDDDRGEPGAVRPEVAEVAEAGEFGEFGEFAAAGAATGASSAEVAR